MASIVVRAIDKEALALVISFANAKTTHAIALTCTWANELVKTRVLEPRSKLHKLALYSWSKNVSETNMRFALRKECGICQGQFAGGFDAVFYVYAHPECVKDQLAFLNEAPDAPSNIPRKSFDGYSQTKRARFKYEMVWARSHPVMPTHTLETPLTAPWPHAGARHLASHDSKKRAREDALEKRVKRLKTSLHDCEAGVEFLRHHSCAGDFFHAARIAPKTSMAALKRAVPDIFATSSADEVVQAIEASKERIRQQIAERLRLREEERRRLAEQEKQREDARLAANAARDARVEALRTALGNDELRLNFLRTHRASFRSHMLPSEYFRPGGAQITLEQIKDEFPELFDATRDAEDAINAVRAREEEKRRREQFEAAQARAKALSMALNGDDERVLFVQTHPLMGDFLKLDISARDLLSRIEKYAPELFDPAMDLQHAAAVIRRRDESKLSNLCMRERDGSNCRNAAAKNCEVKCCSLCCRIVCHRERISCRRHKNMFRGQPETAPSTSV